MNKTRQKFLILTCDSEAVPSFAPDNHVDRLIWGRFPGAPYEAGIGKLMDVADEFGAKIVFFHDVLEEHSYEGETARAARYIVSRGHDLQLHMHTEFLPPEFWARIGSQTPTWSMNLYNAETARHVMEHGVKLFESMVGFKPVAYRAGAFRYNARILEALQTCGIPLSFQYYPASALKPSFPHGFDAGLLPVFKWRNGVIEVPLAMHEYPHPRQHPYRYRALDLNQLPEGVEQAQAMMTHFWENGPEFNVCVMLLHSWSFLQKDDAGHLVWKDDSLVRLFSDFLKSLPLDVRVITASELLTRISKKEVVPPFEIPIQIAGTEGIPLLQLQTKHVDNEGLKTVVKLPKPTTKASVAETKSIPSNTNGAAEAIRRSYDEEQRELRRREVESYPYPNLEEVHVREAELLISRYQLLEKLPKHATVCEIGVSEGDFSAQILEHCKPAKLHLIDLWDSSGRKKIHSRFADAIADGRVMISAGTSTERLVEFPDHVFDWVYLDTVHDYRVTAQELAICQKKVRPGGIIAGHDHTPGNIITPVCYGVVQAVQEFCVQHRWRYLFLTCESHCYASFAIQAIDANGIEPRTNRHDEKDKGASV
jgi:hypothetical protein